MSNYTDSFENKLHDFLNRGQSLTIGAAVATWSVAPTYWFGLLTTLGDDAGGHVECTGVAYERVPVVSGLATITGTDGNTTGVSTGTDGTGDNANIIQFAVPGAGGWGTAVGFARFDALTGGNVIDKALFTSGSGLISSGADIKFAVGAAAIQIDG